MSERPARLPHYYNRKSLTHPAGKAFRGGADEAQLAIEGFLTASRQPAVLEPGMDPIAIGRDNFVLERRAATLVIQCWDERQNLVRRVRRIREAKPGRLLLEIERFGNRTGVLVLADLAAPRARAGIVRSERLKFREQFRRFLSRQFAGWKIAELTTEPDLEHSLSPSYPRALLRKGAGAWAAIGAPPDGADPEGVLSFGLIWLDYLRRREPRPAVAGLALFVPLGTERTTCFRLRSLREDAAQYSLFAYSDQGQEGRIDLRDQGNLDTRLEVCRRPLIESPAHVVAWVDRLAALEGVERLDRNDGSVSLRVRGLEFARAAGGELLFGLERKQPADAANLAEIERIAAELARFRRADAHDRGHPLFLKYPEAWLESQVRAHLEEIDAGLARTPLYGQVPAFAGGERGVIDLVAADLRGRLAVLELKASEDIQLPLQALDYWMRVKWHLDRGEFSSRGYFPGVELRREPPRLLLVAPALQFHPTNEVILRYFSPAMEVERIGVGIEWHQKLKVMFRWCGGECPLPFSSRSDTPSPG